MLTISEFANKIRTRYNAYHDVDDTLLTERFLEKYPVYSDRVDFQPVQPIDQNLQPIAPAPAEPVEGQAPEDYAPSQTMQFAPIDVSVTEPQDDREDIPSITPDIQVTADMFQQQEFLPEQTANIIRGSRDAYQIAEQIVNLTPRKKEEAYKLVAPEMLKEVQQKEAEISSASPGLGEATRMAAQVADVAGKDIVPKAQTQPMGEGAQARYERGKVVAESGIKPTESADKLALTYYKQRKSAPAFKEKTEEIVGGIKSIAEILDPLDYKRYKIQERINALSSENNEYAQAWQRGDLGFVIDKYMADAMMSDDEEAIQKARMLKKRYQSVAQDTTHDSGKLKSLALSTVEMLAPMAKTGIKTAVPVVGQVWGVSEWARQGAGDVYSSLRDEGVSHEVAKTIAPIAGLTYASVENLQLKQVMNIPGKVAKEGIQKGFKKAFLKLLKEKGKDYVSEVGEEGLQRLTTDLAVELGKTAEGKQDKNFKELLLQEMKNVGEEMYQAAGPMSVLTALGIGGGVARSAFDAKTPTIEDASGQRGKRKYGEEGIASKRIEEGTYTAQQDKAAPMDQPPAQTPASQEADTPATGEEAPLAQPTVNVDEFYALSEQEQAQRWPLLSEEEQNAILADPRAQEVKALDLPEADEIVDESIPENKDELPKEVKVWKISVGDRKVDRITLTSEAQKLIEQDKADGITPRSMEQALKDADLMKRESVTGQPSAPHFYEEVDKIYSDTPVNHETVQHYHLHGDEEAFVYAWMGEDGKQHAIYAKADIPNFAPFNETEGLGHEWTNDLNKLYQAEQRHFLENSPLLKQAKTDAEKRVAFVSTMAKLKESISLIEVSVGDGKRVNLGLNIGISENPATAEEVLNKVAENVGRNSIDVDNDLKRIYNIKSIKGEDLTEQYYEAGLRSTKLKARYDELQKQKAGNEVLGKGKTVQDDARGDGKGDGIDEKRKSQGRDYYPRSLEPGQSGSRVLKYNQKFKDSSADQKYKMLRADVQGIEAALARELTTSERVYLEGLKKQLNKESKKYSKVGQEKQAAVTSQQQRWFNNEEVKTVEQKRLQEQMVNVANALNVDEVSIVLPNRKPVEIKNAISQLKNGKAKTRVAKELRKRIWKGLQIGMTDSDIAGDFSRQADQEIPFSKGRITDEAGDLFAGTDLEDKRTKGDKALESTREERDQKRKEKESEPLPLSTGENVMVVDKAGAVTDGYEQTSLFSKGKGLATGNSAVIKNVKKEVFKKLSPSLQKGVKVVYTDNLNRGGENVFSVGKDGSVNEGMLEPGEKQDTVYINSSLPKNVQARVLVHEVMGHYGAINVLKSNPKLELKLRTIFKKDMKEQTSTLKDIVDLYYDPKKPVPKNMDTLYAEWIARRMENHIADPGADKISQKVFEAIRNFLVDIGILAGDVDDVMRQMVKEMKTTKDARAVSRTRESKAKGDALIAETQPNDKTLIAVHNLPANSVVFANDLGGLPAPSIAILRPDIPFEGYGEISLIAKSDTIDPRYDKVFNSDIYSGRSPKVEWDISRKNHDNLSTRIYNAKWEMLKNSGYGNAQVSLDNKNKERFLTDAMSDVGVKATFLREKGVEIQPVMVPKRVKYRDIVEEGKVLKEYFDSLDIDKVQRSGASSDIAIKARKGAAEAFEAELESRIKSKYGKEPELVESIVTRQKEEFIDEDGTMFFAPFDSLIRAYNVITKNEKEPDSHATKNAVLDEFSKFDQNTFEDWLNYEADKVFINPHLKKGRKKVPVTLDNMVSLTINKGIRGQEKNIAFGLGQARAMGAKQLKTREQMKAFEPKIVTREEMKKAKDEQDKKWDVVVDMLGKYYEYQSAGIFDKFDDLSRAIADYYKGGKTIARMKAAMKKNGYGEATKTNLHAETLMEFAEYIQNMPTEYFEAKPERAVDLNEFAAAVVPSTVNDATRQILVSKGLDIVEYDGSKPGDRTEKIKNYKPKKVLFSKGKAIPAKAQEETKEFKNWFGDSKVVDKDGKPLVVYHGTTHDIKEFSMARGNPENAFGKGFYFTTSPEDASINYAGEGPDLTNRIDQLTERIESNEDIESDKAREKALKQLKGEHDGAVMPVYVKMEKPFDMTEDAKSDIYIERDEEYYLDLAKDRVERDDYDGDDEYEEALREEADEIYYDDYDPKEDGDGVEILDAIEQVVNSNEYLDIDQTRSEVAQDFRMHLQEYDRLTPKQVYDWLEERLEYATDEDGNLASHDIIREIVQRAGYDGAIQDAYTEFGPGRKVGQAMEGIDYGDRHFISFEPTNVKSAIGNTGAFDPSKPEIMYSLGKVSPEQKIEKYFDNANSLGYTKEDQLIEIGNDKQVKEYINEVSQQLSLFDDEQLSLFAKDVQAGPKSKGLDDKTGQSELQYGKYTKSKIPSIWKKQKRIDFVGTQINNPQNVYQTFSVYRNPRSETFQLVYVDKKGKVLAHHIISSGAANYSAALQYDDPVRSAYKHKRRMASLGASGYYMVHNHPTETMSPSKADINITGLYQKRFHGFIGHLIMDHDKYHYIYPSEKTGYLTGHTGNVGKPSEDYMKARKEDKVVISGPASVASYSKEAMGATGSKLGIIVLDTQMNVAAFSPLTKKESINPQTIHQKVREAGGAYSIVVAENKEDFLYAKDHANLRHKRQGTTIIDVVLANEKEVISARNEGKVFFSSEKRKPKKAASLFVFETDEPVFSKGKAIPAEYSNIAGIERAARSLRGKLLHISKDNLAQRAAIEVELGKYTKERDQFVRNSIYDYAHKIGLNKEALNRVDTMLKNEKTLNGLLKSIEKMDEILAKKQRSTLRKQLENKIKKEKARLIGKQGKKKSKIAAEQDNALLDYLNSLMPTASRNEWTQLNSDVEKQLNEILNNPEKDADEANALIEKMFRPSISDMTSKELLSALNKIATIKRLGKLRGEIQEAKRQERIKKTISDSVDEIGKAPFVHPLKKTKENEKKGTLKYLGELASDFSWSHIRPEMIAKQVGGWKKGSFYQNTFKKVLDAEQKKLAGLEAADKRFKEIYKDIDIEEAYTKPAMTVMVEDDSGVSEVVLSLNNMMHVYAHSQNPGGRAHLAGTGFTEDLILEVIEKLPAEHKAAVDKQMEYYDNVQWDKVNDVFEREHNIRMPKETNYFPIMNLDTRNADAAIMADILARHNARRATIEKGMTKSRVNSNAAFKTNDYFQTVVRNASLVEHYLAFSDVVKDVNAVISNPDVKAAIENKAKGAWKQMDNWIKAVAYGKISASQQHIFDRWSDYLRNNYVSSVLGFNLVTRLKQTASLSQGMAFSSKPHVALASAEFAKKTYMQGTKLRNGLIDFVKEKSIMMRNRSNDFERELAEQAEKGELGRALGITQSQLDAGLKPGWLDKIPYVVKTKGGLEKVKELSMRGIQDADMATTTVLWYGKYRESLDKGMSESRAKSAADELIRTTQPMGGVVHLPSIFRGGGLARAYTMFKNQLNQNWNINREMFKTLKLEKTLENMEKFAFMNIIPAMLLYMSTYGFQPPWKDPEGWVVQGISNIVSGFTFVGSLMEGALMRLADKSRELRGGRRKFNRNIDMLLDFSPTSLSAMEDAGEIITAKNQGRLGEIAASVASKVAGIPYTQAKRTIKGGKRVVEGWKKAEGAQEKAKLLRNLIWSEYALKPRSIESDKVKMFSSPKDEAEAVRTLRWYKKLSAKKKREFAKKVDDFPKKLLSLQRKIAGKKKKSGGRTGTPAQKFAKRKSDLQKQLIQKKITKKEFDVKIKMLEKRIKSFKKEVSRGKNN
jgi:hypothetical protein